MKNSAGDEAHILSFIFNLTNTPRNISIASPPDEINKTGFNESPTNNPIAPRNCKMMVRRPNFSSLKRLNSFFI